MKSFYLILLIATLIGCQTARIKNEKYKISPATTELGSIGQGETFFNLENNFSTRSLPMLQNKIRLDIQILPLTSKLNKAYVEKGEYNQSQSKITYVDSLSNKPEFAAISILDLTGFAGELNASYNKNMNSYLQEVSEAVVVTRIAITLPNEDLMKIRQADTYYLENSQDKKYTIALYKEGKKIDTLDLHTGVILAYKLGKFCWAENNKRDWYIGDIVEDTHGCKGNTKHQVKDEETNLFKM